MSDEIKILSESDILSNLSTMCALLEINGKRVRVIRLDFEDLEINQKGTNFRFELPKDTFLTEEETQNLNEFVNKMKW